MITGGINMKLVYCIALLNILSGTPLISCATCVGKVRHESPPFFADDFYQKGNVSQSVYLDAKRIKNDITVSGFKDKESMPKLIRKSAISG